MREDIIVGPRFSSTKELLQFLECQYDLGSIRTHRDLGGTYNLNLYLRASTGDYVARIYRPWVTQERLITVQTIKGWLKENGFPVILPMATRDLMPFTIYENRLLEVEAYVSHRPPAQHKTVYRQAFQCLGRLHHNLAQYPGSQSIFPPLIENYGTPDLIMDWMVVLLQRFRSINDPRVSDAAALTERAIRILELLQKQWLQVRGSLPYQLIHGDFGTGNLLWAEDRITTVLDFDFIAYHERIFDLAYALYWMWFRTGPVSTTRGLLWERVADLIGFYRQGNRNQISQEESNALPFEMARVPLYWIAEAKYLDNPVEAVIRQTRGVDISEWLVRHSDEWSEGGNS